MQAQVGQHRLADRGQFSCVGQAPEAFLLWFHVGIIFRLIRRAGLRFAFEALLRVG
jgi:hypothetical protein